MPCSGMVAMYRQKRPGIVSALEVLMREPLIAAALSGGSERQRRTEPR